MGVVTVFWLHTYFFSVPYTNFFCVIHDQNYSIKETKNHGVGRPENWYLFYIQACICIQNVLISRDLLYQKPQSHLISNPYNGWIKDPDMNFKARNNLQSNFSSLPVTNQFSNYLIDKAIRINRSAHEFSSNNLQSGTYDTDAVFTCTDISL